MFKIVGWNEREAFPDLLAPTAPAMAAITHAGGATHEPEPAPALAELISDEIPF